MSSSEPKPKRAAPVHVPRSQRTHDYVPNRIARLRRRKNRAELLAWAIVALGIAEAFAGSVVAGAAIAGLALLGRVIIMELCNLYIDVLAGQWADADRDRAMDDIFNTEMDGWEIPMNVPNEPF